MFSLAAAIPDPKDVLILEPEELGAELLFLIREDGNAIFHPNNWIQDPTKGLSPFGSPSPYAGKEMDIELAMIEAFAWLEAQGLIVPAPASNGSQGFRCLSRRARRFENKTDFKQYALARRLQKDMLHPRIAQKVWAAFVRGEYDVAVFQAMKAVEVFVREASDLPKLLGVPLMRAAFHSDTGPLTDRTAEAGEQEARQHLFAGAIGSFKNPHSHRDVPLDNAAEATEVILLANHLLRIVDSRQSSTAKPA